MVMAGIVARAWNSSHSLSQKLVPNWLSDCRGPSHLIGVKQIIMLALIYPSATSIRTHGSLS